MNFVFFGTPEPAVEILDALFAKGFVPALVVTAPDKPQGRKLLVTPPPVKVWALAHGIPFIQPSSLTDPEVLRQLSKVNGQLFIVVAYGSLIPKEILALPKHGSLNVHYSLLPKYRGASPIEFQILNDDRDAGISILLLDEEMDHGPIVAEKSIPHSLFPIPDWPPTATELRKISNQVAGELLADILPDWISGKIQAKPQDHRKATYTRKFKKTDGELDLSGDLYPDEVERQRRAYKNLLKIKAFEGSIGTYFFVEKSEKKMRVSIKDAKMEGDKLVITRVVPEGKKEMSYEEFVRGLVKRD